MELEMSAAERDGEIVRGFVPLALRTCSPNFYGSRVPKLALKTALENVIAAAELLDGIKKLMFYGRPVKVGTFEVLGITDDMPHVDAFNDFLPEPMRDIMHGIIGIITEGGELAEVLHKALNDTRAELDVTNLHEELGDVLWYYAPIFKHTGSSFPAEMLRVVGKLRTRFPDKYADEHANNRDLSAERLTLEKEHYDSRETSGEVASLGGAYMDVTAEQLAEMLATDPENTINEIRSIAASVVSQSVPAW